MQRTIGEKGEEERQARRRWERDMRNEAELMIKLWVGGWRQLDCCQRHLIANLDTLKHVQRKKIFEPWFLLRSKKIKVSAEHATFLFLFQFHFFGSYLRKGTVLAGKVFERVEDDHGWPSHEARGQDEKVGRIKWCVRMIRHSLRVITGVGICRRTKTIHFRNLFNGRLNQEQYGCNAPKTENEIKKRTHLFVTK